MEQKQTENSHWSKQKEKGSYWGIRILFAIYSVAGSWLLAPILYPVVFYFFLFGKKARQGSTAFLQRALPYRPSRYDSFRLFMAFAKSILDKISSWAGKVPRSEVSFPTRPNLAAAIESGKGGVILGSHLGSIEVGRAFSRYLDGFKLNVLVYTHHAGNFNKMMRAVNQDFETELIQVTSIGPDTAMLLKQKVENGEFLAILGDRPPVGSKDREVWLPFLGKEAPFPQGPFILASILDCPLYMLTCLRGDNGFDVYFDELADRVVLPRKTRQKSIENYAKLYVDLLASYAVKYPYQWFNFFDFWRELDNSDSAQLSE